MTTTGFIHTSSEEGCLPCDWGSTSSSQTSAHPSQAEEDLGYSSFSLEDKVDDLVSSIPKDLSTASPESLQAMIKKTSLVTPEMMEKRQEYKSALQIAALQLPTLNISSLHDRSVIDTLNLDTPQSHDLYEAKALQFFALERFPSIQRACDVLRYPCAQSLNIASRFMEGDDPLSSQEGPLLGAGGCGVVRKMKVEQQSYAAKTVHNESLLRNECRIPPTLSHPHLLQTLFIDSANHTLYLPLASQGSLKDHLLTDSLSREDFLRILFETSEAVAYLHAQGYIHRDIKPDNILLGEDMRTLVSDFGAAIKIEDFNSEIVEGTIFYLPIDYLKQETPREHCDKIDVWSFGMLIWQRLKQENYRTPFIYPNLMILKPEKYKDKEYMRYAAKNLNLERYLGSYKSDMSFIHFVTKVFRGFEEGDLERTLDPVKCSKYDPDGQLRTLMKHCLAYQACDRPSMDAIKQSLLRT